MSIVKKLSVLTELCLRYQGTECKPVYAMLPVYAIVYFMLADFIMNKFHDFENYLDTGNEQVMHKTVNLTVFNLEY